MTVASLVGGGSMLLAAPVAVAAGLVGFLSPCVLPLVPGYLSYVTGLSGAELAGEGSVGTRGHSGGLSQVRRAAAPAPTGGGARSRVLAGAALFVLGFTAVFVTAGALFGQLGSSLATHRRVLEQVLGVVTVVVGLAFAGLLTRVPRLGAAVSRDLRPHLRPGTGLAAAPALGLLFGLGWSPCLGPTLTAVYGLSAQTSTAARGALLGLAYCLGLGLPFLLVAVAFRRAMGALAVLRTHAREVTAIGGLLLVAVGLLEVSGVWTAAVRALQLGGLESAL